MLKQKVYTLLILLFFISLTASIISMAVKVWADSKKYNVMSSLLEITDIERTLLWDTLQAPSHGPIELPDKVTGFGFYDRNGSGLRLEGTAPQFIEAEELPQQKVVEFSKERLRVISPFGPFRKGRREHSPPHKMHSASPVVVAPKNFIVIDYNVRELVTTQSEKDRNIFMGTLFIISLSALILFLFKRTSSFKEQHSRELRLIQLGEASRVLAHEIKNPLGILKMQVSILKKQTAEKGQPHLNIVDEEITRLTKLTDRVREFLQDSTGTPTNVDLYSFFGKIKGKWGEQLSLINIDANTPSPYIDEEHLHTAVTNIVMNGLESMDNRGSVEVSVRERWHTLSIDIVDRGVGIPSSEYDKIFSPFHTTKTKGSGVGLSISKRLIEGADGSIAVSQREGEELYSLSIFL